MNNCSFIGRATKDFELRRTNSGKAVCSFTLAVDRPRVKDATDFIDFVVFGQGAEYLCKYASKGRKIAATGSLTSRKWEDKDGNKRTSWEIICDTVSLEDSKNDNQNSGYTGFVKTDSTPSNSFSNFSVIDEDDGQLPF